MNCPTIEKEQHLWDQGFEAIAGVDEVGRGCLAGPVVAAAVVFPHGHQPIPGIRDSKLVSKRARNLLVHEIYAAALSWGVGVASVQTINSHGIVIATMQAMQKSLRSLSMKDYVLIDGPKAPRIKGFRGRIEAIVDGDALCYSIAAASIIAKVHRDALMTTLSTRFPGYDWEHNVGYATPNHLTALRTSGVTPHHRLLFIRNVLNV